MNQMSDPKVIAVTVNWNQRDVTLGCLESLLAIDYSNFEVVVVDNGSIDGSPRAIKKRFPMVKQVINSENLGYSVGINKGLALALDEGCDYVFILNNDTIVDKEVIKELVKVAETDSNIGFVSGKVYNYDRPKILQYVGRQNDSINLIGGLVGAEEPDVGQYDELRDFDFIDDVFLLVPSSVIKKTGGYYSEFFLYYEEADWCARIRKLGYRIVYAPKAKIWHMGGVSGGGKYNPTKTFWLARNNYLFIWRNGVYGQKKAFLFKQVFYNFPLTLLSLIVRGRFFLIYPYLSGNLSGLNWIINSQGKNIKIKLRN